MADKQIRILAIDGGGVRGIIPATLLAKLVELAQMENPEISVADRNANNRLFDYIIGTSIGGILSAGYAMPSDASNPLSAPKYNASQVTDILSDNGQEIFANPRGKLDRYLNNKAKFSRKGLDDLANREFGDTILNETIIPISLVSFDDVGHTREVQDTELVNLPRIWSSCSNQFSRYKIADAAGATSAAPTYFPPKYTQYLGECDSDLQCATVECPDNPEEKCLKDIDGGVFANSPAILGSALLQDLIYNSPIVTDQCKNALRSIICPENPAGCSPEDYSISITSSRSSISGNVIPRLSLQKIVNGTLEDEVDIVVVSFGTGYYDDASEGFNLDSAKAPINWFSGPLVALGVVKVVASFLGAYSCHHRSCFKSSDYQPISDTNIYKTDKFSAGLVTGDVIGTLGLFIGAAIGLCTGSATAFSVLAGIGGVGGGVLGAIAGWGFSGHANLYYSPSVAISGIIEGVLKIIFGGFGLHTAKEIVPAYKDGNNQEDGGLSLDLFGILLDGEAKIDSIVSHGVFGSIRIQPSYKSSDNGGSGIIDLDDAKNETIAALEQIALNYYNNITDGFNNTVQCLINPDISARRAFCDQAYDEFPVDEMLIRSVDQHDDL